MPPVQSSSVHFQEIVDDYHWFFRSFRDRQQRHIVVRRTVLAVLCAAAVGGAVGLGIAVGQTWALGMRAAYSIYGSWWLLAPLISICFLLGFFFLSYILLVVPSLIFDKVGSWFSEEAKQAVQRVGKIIEIPSVILMLLTPIVIMPIKIGFDIARDNNPVLADDDKSNLKSIENLADEQQEAASRISRTARVLLSSLAGMQTEIARLENNLEVTVAQLERQDAAASVSARRAKELIGRQEQIEIRIEEMERLLEGQSVITRADLEQSGWRGLWMGAVLGFAMSLLAAYVYERVVVRRRNRRPTPPST